MTQLASNRKIQSLPRLSNKLKERSNKRFGFATLLRQVYKSKLAVFFRFVCLRKRNNIVVESLLSNKLTRKLASQTMAE